MQDERSLSKIEGNCNLLLNSPYLQKEVPNELKNLRTVLEKVTILVREDVPSLVAEIRHLRNQNRKLEAELEAMRSTSLNSTTSPTSPVLTDETLAETLTTSLIQTDPALDLDPELDQPLPTS